MNAVAFGQFNLRLQPPGLFRHGKPVKLGGRALDILCVLAGAHGDVVSKYQLLDRVWPGVAVEENNLAVHISALRRELADGMEGESLLITVPGRGYRLTGLKDPAPVQALPAIQQWEGIPGASIAVLSFENLSTDPQQEYFADGVVEDIITGLARINWLSVIARNSTFTYKGKANDIEQVRKDLGVRYVLKGSIRRSSDRVRIVAQLIETRSGVHLWAERYDRSLDDIFAVQDEIAMSVIGAIEPNLRKAEIERVKRKRPESLDAYDLVLRALPFVHKWMPDGATDAIPLLKKALEIEPGYTLAHALLARCFHFRFSRAGLRAEDRIAAIHHARAAIIGDSDDATTLAIAALVIWFDERDSITALDLFDRALALSHSNVTALGNSAFVLAWMGKVEIAIDRAQRAIQLCPFDNTISYMALSLAQIIDNQYEQARESARRAVESTPDFSIPHAILAVALVCVGSEDEAKAEARSVLELDPTFTTGNWAVTVGQVPEVFGPISEALRKAGIP
jgi:TolB-like protein/DNA-binding winged helix-turn-helix (wHTH) protein